MKAVLSRAWSDFPQSDLIAVLQELAQAALQATLMPHDADGYRPTPDAWAAPALLAILTPDTQISWVERRALGRLHRRFHVGSPPQPTRALGVWAEEALPHGRLALWRNRWEGFRARTTEGPAAAHHLRDSLAGSAWTEPAFRLWIFRTVRTHIRSRVLIWPLPDGGPDIQEETLWILIAAWMRSQPASGHRRYRARLPAALDQQALTYAERTDWAQFWDIYLLRRAQAERLELPATPALQNGLRLSVPMDRDAGPAQPPAKPEIDENDTTDVPQEADTNDASILHSDWRARAPHFADALLSGGI